MNRPYEQVNIELLRDLPVGTEVQLIDPDTKQIAECKINKGLCTNRIFIKQDSAFLLITCTKCGGVLRVVDKYIGLVNPRWKITTEISKFISI